jgi:hypothetical protein
MEEEFLWRISCEFTVILIPFLFLCPISEKIKFTCVCCMATQGRAREWPLELWSEDLHCMAVGMPLHICMWENTYLARYGLERTLKVEFLCKLKSYACYSIIFLCALGIYLFIFFFLFFILSFLNLLICVYIVWATSPLDSYFGFFS